MVEYEWDAAKAAGNCRRHGIDFPDSIAAIELFVVTTLRGDRTCRIISARRATRHEQDRYYEGDREAW